jgi:Domain of unknown function (DUF4249)
MKLYSIIFFTILFASCEKVITIKPPNYLGKPSIQGMLEPDSVPKVYFNQSVPFFNEKVSFQDLVIRNAQIKIQSSFGIDSLKLDSVYNGVYCQYDYFYKGNSIIKTNTMYNLNVVSSVGNFTATAQTNQLSPIIDSVSYTSIFKDLYGEHEGVITYFKDVPTQANYYRYEMVRFINATTQLANNKALIFCIGGDSLRVNEIGRSVYADEGLNAQQLKVVVEPAYTHKLGIKGVVYIQSIDKNAFDFFDQLDKQKLAQYNPFVEPVFLTDGQFGNKAIGYFSAMRKSIPATFVFPE